MSMAENTPYSKQIAGQRNRKQQQHCGNGKTEHIDISSESISSNSNWSRAFRCRDKPGVRDLRLKLAIFNL